MIFPIDSYVVYGSEGVCKVAHIGTPEIPMINKDAIYYTLAPLYREGKIYIPVNTEKPIRPVITKEQAKALIGIIPELEEQDISDTNANNLGARYQEMIGSYDCQDLIQLIKTVYMKKIRLSAFGKKLGQVDERYMRQAEDLLNGELAVALNVPKGEVNKYIEESINGRHKAAKAT